MEVKKGGQTICTTSGFNIIPSCQTKICEWNTQGTTAGEYLLSSYYGGHNDGCPNNPCCDNTYTCYTNVILNSSTPTPIRTPTPTPTLTPCNFAGVGEVRDYNNKQVLENKSGFWWLNYRGQNGQFPTGGPVRTEWRPSVLPTQYIINNAWIALTPAPGYVLKDTFCEKPVDCSYGTPGCEESNVCTGSYLRGPTPIINTRFNCNLSYTYGWYVDRSAPTKSPTPTLTPTCSPFPSKTPTPTLSPLIPTDTPVPTSTLTPSPTSASMPTPTPSRFPCNSNCAYNSQCATNYCWFVSGTCRNPNCPANLWCRCF
ncbi:hypothetical protein FJY90_04405 [Candidatus Gottesmanbacteria bacterium]|nr:hypothetical protein [Candidatus Gottesmanbacteria bacterium]